MDWYEKQRRKYVKRKTTHRRRYTPPPVEIPIMLSKGYKRIPGTDLWVKW